VWAEGFGISGRIWPTLGTSIDKADLDWDCELILIEINCVNLLNPPMRKVTYKFGLKLYYKNLLIIRPLVTLWHRSWLWGTMFSGYFHASFKIAQAFEHLFRIHRYGYQGYALHFSGNSLKQHLPKRLLIPPAF
jgi:hypothetical protein